MARSIKYLVLVVLCCMGEVQVMAKKRSLITYQEKRDFKTSPEPKGKALVKKSTSPIFVIQKHDASHLHYDLRLEIDGVLVSWAVPKGPSLNPQEKHLAIMTEDHPIEYADFEGVIPEGQYGGGTVMVWDTGTYKNIKEKNGKLVSMDECLKNGQIEVFLEGKKLKGGFALIKTQYAGGDNWLLMKMKDEFASARKKPVNSQNKSAITGRTMQQIKKAG